MRQARVVAMGVLSLWLASSLPGPTPARVAAQSSDEGSIAFAPPERLFEDDRAELQLLVRPPAGGRSFLLTLRGEGTAVEVVRGRLLPSDAVDAEARPMVFRVPIVARGRGVALVHAQLTGWSCEDTCHAVTLETSTTLRVAARPPS